MHYVTLVQTYEELQSTSKRLEKTAIIANLLQKTKEDNLEIITLLLRGKVFPAYDDRKIGIASKLVVKALSISTGMTADNITKEWKQLGGLGKVAEKISKTKVQATLFSSKLSVEKVFKSIQKLSTIEGKGSVDIKLKVISELFSSASPLEAKYLTRTLLEDLRIGVGDGALRDAIVWAYFPKEKAEQEEDKDAYKEVLELVEHAYEVTNDFGKTAKAAAKGRKALRQMTLTTGTPPKVMLFQKAKDFEDAFETVGTPCAIEYKYDGFRVQIHKQQQDIKLFTRRLEDVTKQFPEVVQWVQEDITAKSCILDGEIIGIDSKGHYLPFQHISQRIKRKHNIDQLVKKIPVIVRLFDIMQVEENNLLKEPFQQRREHLKDIVKEEKNLHLAEQIITSSPKEAKDFYEKAIKKGNEGVMMKKLDAPYKPGSRVGYGVKIKSVMETLDLVIVAAEWGEGKRANWLSSFTLACKDGDDFREIGKVGTGFKEKDEEGLSFNQLTELLKPLITQEEGKTVQVEPEIVLEIEYEELQKSPTYASGYALRFPRVIQLREDKPIDEITTIDEIDQYYKEQ